MVYGLVLCLILCGSLGKIIEKSWINMLTLFSFMWAVIAYLASMGLYRMNAVSYRPYLLVGIGVLCFTVGYYIYYRYPFHFALGQAGKTKKEYKCKEVLFRALFFATVVVWLCLAFKTLQEVLGGISYEYIRDIYGGVNEDHTLFTNKYVDTIVKLFFVPAVYVVLTKIFYSFFDKQYQWYFYVLSFVLLGSYCFTTGSRQILFILVLQMVFLLNFKVGKNQVFKISKKVKRRLGMLMVVAVIGIVLITVFRPSKSHDIVWTTNMAYYAYASLPIPMTDYWMKHVDLTGVHTYGLAFFKGILSLITRFKLPMPASYYKSMEFIGECANTYIPIFGSKTFCAFISIFFYFYMDFGYFGVVAGSFIFGLMCSAVYRVIKKNQNEYATMIFLIFLISVIKSFARWEFAQADYIMMFIIARLLYKKKTMKKEQSKLEDNR